MEVATNRPRFRTDLVAECIEAEGQRFIDVIDPDTGDAFRFYEVEYSLACAMDGERDLATLASWAREELGIEPSPAELRTVIATLGELGYLEAQPVSMAAAEMAARRGAAEPSAAAEASASAAAEDELGVTVGVYAAPRQVVPPSGVEVDLGRAGGSELAEEPLPEAAQVDLGHVEVAAAPVARVAAEEVADVELGTAGGTPEPVPTLRRQTQPSTHEYSDEPTNLPAPQVGDFDDEVSVDLSEHLAIGRDDVKEAVRMSRSMKAVDVPQDLLDQLGEQEAQAAERAKRAAQAASAEMVVEADEPTPPPRDMPVAAAAAAAAERAQVAVSPVVAEKTPEKAPVELPSRQAAVATRDRVVDKAPEKVVEKAPIAEKSPHERPIADAMARPGTSPVLIILLVLVLLAGGAFVVWKYVLNKPDAEETGAPKAGTGSPKAGTAVATGAATGTGTAVATGVATGTAVATGAATGTGTAVATGAATGTGAGSATPTPITATLAAGPEAGVPITSEKGGVVLFIVSEGTEVAAGDVVAKFQGVAALEKELGNKTAGLLWDIEVRVPKEIDKYTKARDKAVAEGNKAAAKAQELKLVERTQRLDEKKLEAEKLRARIAALTVTAPAAGKVATPVARGKRVGAGEQVATLAGAASLIATFDVSAAPKKDFAVDQLVDVFVPETPDQKVGCVVAGVEGPKVSVTCPADSGLAVGTAVALSP